MADGTRKGTPTGQSLRPRRTERAHRGKPDFYSPSDYENPFKRQRRRTSSAEAEIVKRKGRPPNSMKSFKFKKQEQKNEDDSSRDNDEGSTDSSKRSGYEEKQSESPIPRKPERERREIKPTATKAKIINTNVQRHSKPIHAAVHKPSKTLNLCSDMPHNKAKEMTLMKDVNSKDKEKEGTGNKEGKEGPSTKHTDLYNSLTSEKSLQCAIILAEINRKFMCQNFKPS